ncbi:MAG: hypothetical protein GY930_00470 [bacterium]|nr:hypothetical protein [bacterium]
MRPTPEFRKVFGKGPSPEPIGEESHLPNAMQIITWSCLAILPLALSQGVHPLHGSATQAAKGLQAVQIGTWRHTVSSPRLDWKTLGNGPDRSGYYEGVVGHRSLAPLWQTLGVHRYHQAVIENGTVYAVNDDSYLPSWLRAHDPVTGQVLWTHPFRPTNYLTPPSVDKANLIAEFEPWSMRSDMRVLLAESKRIPYSGGPPSIWR